MIYSNLIYIKCETFNVDKLNGIKKQNKKTPNPS